MTGVNRREILHVDGHRQTPIRGRLLRPRIAQSFAGLVKASAELLHSLDDAARDVPHLFLQRAVFALRGALSLDGWLGTGVGHDV